jgi:hypothetical protein
MSWQSQGSKARPWHWICSQQAYASLRLRMAGFSHRGAARCTYYKSDKRCQDRHIGGQASHQYGVIRVQGPPRPLLTLGMPVVCPCEKALWCRGSLLVLISPYPTGPLGLFLARGRHTWFSSYRAFPPWGRGWCLGHHLPSSPLTLASAGVRHRSSFPTWPIW